MALRDRIERILEGNGEPSTGRKAWVFSVLAGGSLAGWLVYTLFFMPPYKKAATLQPVTYTSGVSREIQPPPEAPIPPAPLPRAQGTKAEPEPVRAVKQRKVETEEEKYRKRARLLAHYSGPFGQAWMEQAKGTQGNAQAADTKPEQVLEVPPVTQVRNEPGVLHPPQSLYTVAAGSVIPVALDSGFDTQVGGQITATVIQDIRDTRTGKYVMIPRGSKVRGVYSVNLPYDQDRVETAWSELILPSQETMQLASFPGADRTGVAGQPVEVNTHFWKTAGRSLLLTLTGAAADVARRNSYSSGSGNYGFDEALGNQGGAELQRRSRQVWDRGGYRGPTGTAKAGEVFLLQVTSNMTFPGDYYQRNRGNYAFAE